MRILHVFRMPVGGLFRHVRDLARGQQALGHQVGMLCDSSTGGSMADRLLREVEPACDLGIARIPISRLPGLGDLSGVRQTLAHAVRLRPDIIHCHGAKGGLHGRLAARQMGLPAVYTPHGGSLHYSWSSPAGAAFLAAERALGAIGSGAIFVCNFERDAYDAKIGLGSKPHAVVYNGVWPEEFATIAPPAGAADILFIGDMRLLKGVDVLLEAIARLRKSRPLTACLVGDGPDLARFKSQSAALGLTNAVTFPGRLTAAEAFLRGRMLVMPSRAESFPYVVLEAGAAGVPMIASQVGGIPEILPAGLMVPPGNVTALADRLASVLDNPERVTQMISDLRQKMREAFTVTGMAEGVTSLYAKIIS